MSSIESKQGYGYKLLQFINQVIYGQNIAELSDYEYVICLYTAYLQYIAKQ